jgi:hypothetical protein
MTFAHLQPFAVSVARVEVEDHRTPAADANDVSSSFPTPPDVALRRYAESRLKATGTDGTLRVVIEEGRVRHSTVRTGGKLEQWTATNEKDRYDVWTRVRLQNVYPDGRVGAQSVLSASRWVALPESLSIAQREGEQQKLIKTLIEQDLDKAITKALQNTLMLASPVEMPAVPPTPYTVAPVAPIEGVTYGSDPVDSAPIPLKPEEQESPF